MPSVSASRGEIAVGHGRPDTEMIHQRQQFFGSPRQKTIPPKPWTHSEKSVAYLHVGPHSLGFRSTDRTPVGSSGG